MITREWANIFHDVRQLFGNGPDVPLKRLDKEALAAYDELIRIMEALLAVSEEIWLSEEAWSVFSEVLADFFGWSDEWDWSDPELPLPPHFGRLGEFNRPISSLHLTIKSSTHPSIPHAHGSDEIRDRVSPSQQRP
jgi:hypothetical protein